MKISNKISALFISAFFALNSFAQGGTFDRIGKGARALEDAKSQLQKYVEPAISLAYMVCMIIGVAGAVRVFKKMQAGDQDAAKSAGSLVGAAIIFAIILYIFQRFFLD